MYCNIVKVRSLCISYSWYVDGSRSQVWNWIFWYFLKMAHTVFPPLSLIFLCNIYSLKIQTINNCSKVMEKQTCALSTSFHVMMLKPVQAGKKNKQISWNWYKKWLNTASYVVMHIIHMNKTTTQFRFWTGGGVWSDTKQLQFDWEFGFKGVVQKIIQGA